MIGIILYERDLLLGQNKDAHTRMAIIFYSSVNFHSKGGIQYKASKYPLWDICNTNMITQNLQQSHCRQSNFIGATHASFQGSIMKRYKHFRGKRCLY